ncbi:MAG TPA: DNA gyrase subunit A [Chloroflexota bacterium]|jgi:DNA gyrase subunit A|nr:DNA gyrase subunit A [Chloroflexota bacterium]
MPDAPALTITEIDLDQKMRESYVDYAMSVIVQRALPDVRDGLKPGQRRVLYSMYELSLRHDAAFKKSARVVGDVLGKYHPHGDAAVYDALVRMAQNFNVRYPLIEGQGNFGSIDGDNPAAMRYTEVRLTALAEEMLADLEKNTVPFVDNFDSTLREPMPLPGKAPLFLLNGADGIAVGMATKVPPHNLSELCEAIIALANNPELSTEDLTSILPGPDFPTGGMIVGREGIDRAYATGQGRITVRAVASIEEDGKGRQTIAITELPYQVNKAQLIESISELVRERKLEGIGALRDESDRSGMRIAIELKRDVDAAKLLKDLYRKTKLEETFGINMLALVDGGPHQLSIKRALNLFIEHRKHVITARTQFDLDEASSRLHVLEGLSKALGALDTVIALIRAAQSTEAAQKALVEKLGLTPTQARAILDMRLARLSALERKKIADELKEVMKRVRELEAILSSPRRILNIMIDELRDLRTRFGDDRRTRIIADVADVPVSIEDLIPNQQTVVMLTEDGTIKRLDQFGGRPSAREVPLQYLSCNVRDMLLLFTARGNVHGLPVHRINAVARRSDRGTAVAALIDLQADDRVIALVTVDQAPPPSLIFATARGQVKRSALAEYLTARNAPIVALRLDDGDELVAVASARDGEEVLLHTRGGKAIRFSGEEIRPTGRVAGGVRGIRLEDGDAVLAGPVVIRGQAVLTLTGSGIGRRAPLADYPLQGRDGSGVRAVRLTDKSGPLVAALTLDDRATLEGVDGAGRAIVLEAREVPLQDRQRPGVVVAEGIKGATLLPSGRR